MYYFIINPVARHGRCMRIAPRVLAMLDARGIPYAAAYTQAPGHATALAAEAAAAGYANIVVVGGDGTIYEAVQGVSAYNVRLGFIPAGTGNDFVKSLGIPVHPERALEALLAAQPHPVRVGLCNGRVFLNIASLGFDAAVVAWTARFKKRLSGMFAYLCGVIAAVFTYRSMQVTMRIDGREQSQKVLLMAIANGQYYGGGMRVAPEASVQDEYLDICIVRSVPNIVIPFLLPLFITGRHLRFKKLVRYVRCRSFEIRAPGRALNVDGELIHFEADVHCKIAPRSLCVLAPEGQLQ
nr:diacylglycerol kinase family protein [Maliibacterium massiliense]